jgi:hypothetical protein
LTWYSFSIYSLFLFGTLCTIFGTTALAVFYALCIKRTAYYMISYARDILDPAASCQYNRVFLKIMAFSRYIRIDFNMIRKTHTRDFAERRVGFLGCCCENADADSPALRTILQRTRLAFTYNRLSAVPD